MTASEQYTPARIADRMEIQDALLRWCRGIDRLDLDEIRGVFHPDACDNHGVAVFDVDGLLAWIQDRHKTISMSMHRVSNILIEFAGQDLAIVESYCDVYQCYPPGGQAALAQLTGERDGKSEAGKVFVGAGRYIDRFERRNGRWKIAQRTVTFEGTQVFDMPSETPSGGSNAVRGRRDREDILFKERRALGIGRQDRAT